MPVLTRSFSQKNHAPTETLIAKRCFFCWIIQSRRTIKRELSSMACICRRTSACSTRSSVPCQTSAYVSNSCYGGMCHVTTSGLWWLARPPPKTSQSPPTHSTMCYSSCVYKQERSRWCSTTRWQLTASFKVCVNTLQKMACPNIIIFQEKLHSIFIKNQTQETHKWSLWPSWTNFGWTICHKLKHFFKAFRPRNCA